MAMSNEELIADVEEVEEVEVPAVELEEDNEIVEDDLAADTEEVINSEEEVTDLEESEEGDEVIYTVKVNGEEVEVSEDELVNNYQLSKASQAKFNEASKMRKESDTLMKLLTEDPFYVLEQMNVDVGSLAEKYLSQRINYESLTEDQRELFDAKQKLAQMENVQKQSHEREMQGQVEAARDEYVTRIDTALTAAELPTNDFTSRRMAYYLKEALTSQDPDVQALTDADIVEIVEADYINELKSFNPTKIEQLLGKEVADKIRKNDIKKVKRARGNPAARKASVVPKAASKQKEMSWEEYQDYLDNIK